jgi:Ca2+-binding RTX toxin-like protein
VVTYTVSTAGSSSYNGEVLDAIDFEAPGAATLFLASNFLRTSAPGVLAVAFLGSPNPDTVEIQMIDSMLDARAVTFGEGWNGLADTVVIRDTGLDSTIWGTSRADRIETTGGNDSVAGSTGLDTLVAAWMNRTEDFVMDGAQRIVGSDGTAVAYAGIERLTLKLGSGDDDVRGLAGRDVIQGGLGNDTVAGRAGDDRLFGGEGDDVLHGNQGRDLIVGGRGEDVMLGGAGRDDIRGGGDMAEDHFEFLSVADSTGRGRDVVRGFDAASEDKVSIQLSGPLAESFAGLSVSTRTGGALNSGSFNADLGVALNGVLGDGGLNQAILWDPTGGNLNLAGHRYLVIDMDNDGSYAAGSDLVIQFLNLQGSLDLSDFAVSAIL